MPMVAMVSFRLGGTDGVSIAAATWAWALGRIGFQVRTVAGAGPVDVVVPGLGIDPDGGPPPPPPPFDQVAEALAGADVVIVENLCSLPLNPGAAAVVTAVLAGRPAVLHHHDLPWERPWAVDRPPPPDDRAWAHVVLTERSRRQLALRGIAATVIGATVDTDAPPGDGRRPRALLGVAEGDRLVLQPTRAIPRKDVPTGLALAESLGATFWLTGPAEEGYGSELADVLAGARTRVLRRLPAGLTMADAYAACDAVAFPSINEGFGIPLLEGSVARRPVAAGPNEAAAELAGLGFSWFPAADPEPLRRFLADPDPAVLAANAGLVERHFALHDLPSRLAAVLDRWQRA
jgi:glycosyltransferase involved in cell wall biosynthesis